MGKAEPVPEQTKKTHECIEQFGSEYESALTECRTAEEMTATDGWQHLYSNEMKEQKDERRFISKELANAGERLELLGSTEDDEKLIGDLKKQMVAHRERVDSFHLRVVAPVQAYVDKCHRIIDQAMSRAKRIEEQSPLLYSGLTEQMVQAIKTQPKTKWNTENGIVSVY